MITVTFSPVGPVVVYDWLIMSKCGVGWLPMCHDPYLHMHTLGYVWMRDVFNQDTNLPVGLTRGM